MINFDKHEKEKEEPPDDEENDPSYFLDDSLKRRSKGRWPLEGKDFFKKMV
ncbi:MAG: hypothetical protein PWQ84_1328 [Thermotogaceae bacterium]|nr:hypothetical protein [Thermotogaceae bacterium]